MIVRRWLTGSLWAACLAPLAATISLAVEPAAPVAVKLPVRWVTVAAGSEQVDEHVGTREFVPCETVILICDTWDKHWCSSATKRCDALARQMAPLVEQARVRGVHIIHAPSDTLEFYRDHPARRRAQATPLVKAAVPLGSWCSLEKDREGALPIDDSDGGCDCQPQCKNYKAWSRQHPAIRIDDADLITDNGQEVYNYLQQQGIKNIVYMGVHTNMCVLGRSFGIRQMTKLGFNTVLVRDLTDTMYNPRMRPQVAHDAGTELVVRHVERHWCPTTTRLALVEGLR
jgi:nicotinamidase-related amidase